MYRSQIVRRFPVSVGCRALRTGALCALIVSVLGCHPIVRKRDLGISNPTTFVFPASPDQIHAAVTKAVWRIPANDPVFGPLWKLRIIEVRARGSDSPFGRDIFLNPENADDLYLHSFGGPLCASDVYLCGGGPADFEAAFHLHLRRLDQFKTQVEVLTKEPGVFCGTYPGVPGHGPAGRLVDVPPTTVEEYRLLLAIGRELGVKDMPPLRLPAKDAATTIVWTKGHN